MLRRQLGLNVNHLGRYRCPAPVCQRRAADRGARRHVSPAPSRPGPDGGHRHPHVGWRATAHQLGHQRRPRLGTACWAGADDDARRRLAWRERLPEPRAAGSTVERLREQLDTATCPVCLTAALSERGYLRGAFVSAAATMIRRWTATPGELCSAHMHDAGAGGPGRGVRGQPQAAPPRWAACSVCWINWRRCRPPPGAGADPGQAR